MKITKVNIPKSEADNDGLEDIKMDRLGSVVLLAGKNGSGKTRILTKLYSYLSKKPNYQTIVQRENDIIEYNRNIQRHHDMLKDLKQQLTNSIDPDTITQLRASIDNKEAYIKNRTASYETSILLSKWNFIEMSEYTEGLLPVYFIPKKIELLDPAQINLSNLNGLANSAKNPGIQNLSQTAPAAIQQIQNRWFNVTHQSFITIEEDKKAAIDAYENLKKLIKAFLNTDIGRTQDGEMTLFGLTMGKANLSDGQIILLQLCAAIFSQEVSLKDLILFLDEPENHLHPSVIIEVIDKIQRVVTNGQIWIATHSIPLLAHFDTKYIWYVDKGEIKYAGKTPEKVLSSLLGNDDEISKLQDFINLPAQYATNLYAAECLTMPEAIFTNSKDPQSGQIKEILQNIDSKEKIRILDYGAGKGRLISNLLELDNGEEQKLIERIDYIAFDEFNDNKSFCESAISQAYSESKNRYFNKFKDLFSIYDKESFDVVIMCNVMHEIDPQDWLKLFSENGEITQALNKNGFLLLVEDQLMPIGEKAYRNGFLPLDTSALKDLFKISEKDTQFLFDSKREGRLKVHCIPKECLLRIDENSRCKALETVKDIAKKEILQIRGKKSNYKTGKEHGFWIQQLANATLSLSQLARD